VPLQSLAQTDLPDGLIFRIRVKPFREKYSTSVFQKYVLFCRHPASARGALRVVTNVGAGCDGRRNIGSTNDVAADGKSAWS
jgi:hypothetical protein